MRVKHSGKIIAQDCKNITSNSSNTKRHLTGAQKIITFGFIIITISLLNITHTSALTYQDEIDMQFTFNPTVSINVTGDLTIPDLAPGSYADSNIITVTAGSNDAHGYTLYSTVGSSSSNYTDLRLSPSNTTNKFTSIGVDTVKTTLASFSDDTWGYSYCLTTNNCDTGSNYWVGGNSDSASTGYKGLPIYDASDNTTGVILASTTTPSETELKFKIGAKASSTQVSGTYTNIINFIGIGKVVTTTYNLTYNANAGSDTVTGMPANLTSQTTNDGVIALSTATPTRSGYIFKGWCTDGSSETSCSGTLYEPGRIYIIPAASQGGTVTVNMHAVWKSTEEKPIEEIWYFNEDISGITNCPIYYDITFTNNDQTYNRLYLCSEHGGFVVGYQGGDYCGYDDQWWDGEYGPGWYNDDCRTITITGGADYNNPDFRTWLSANATQL